MVKLQVSNMRCMSCVRNIQDEIAEIDSAVKITADVKNGVIEVDSRLEKEVLILLVQKAGYFAKAVTE